MENIEIINFKKRRTRSLIFKCLRCKKTIKSEKGYCNNCNRILFRKEQIKKRREKNCCVYCGKKSDKIIIKYNSGKIEIKFSYRCKKCRDKLKRNEVKNEELRKM